MATIPQRSAKILLNNVRPELPFNSKNLFYSFPFDLYLGVKSSTETGEFNSSGSNKPNDSATFDEVFTGNNAVIALWRDANYIDPTINNDINPLKRAYRVGEA